jgi:hypothetical protein
MSTTMVRLETGTSMNHEAPQIQPSSPSPPPWLVGLVYVAAIACGAVLIASGHATGAEASGYIAPFLVIFERLTGHR